MPWGLCPGASAQGKPSRGHHTICYLRKYFLLLLPLGRRVNYRLRYGRFTYSHTICYLRKYCLFNCSPLVAEVSILG